MMKSHVFFTILHFLLISLRAEYAGRVVATTHLGFPAYRISDGRTLAVVVPELAGRVMVYGKVDGPNLIYNIRGKTVDSPREGFVNWGGDKTLVGPHALWLTHSPDSMWPPRPSWMSEAHQARVENGGHRLVTIGPVWEGFGLRVMREYSYTDNGALEIKQTLEKVNDAPELMTIWNVTQAVEPDEVFVLRNPDSNYVGSHVFSNEHRASMPPESVSDELFSVRFVPGRAVKLSFDSPEAALAARWGGILWIQRGRLTLGKGVANSPLAVFPVELYTQGHAEGNYVELELMSPAVRLAKDEPATFTLQWSLLDAGEDVESTGNLLRESYE
ncbi:MAG: hypothetical protein WD708_07680 [Kiritimatiellia bacterium]